MPGSNCAPGSSLKKPVPAEPRSWWLQSEGRLRPAAPATGSATFVYDPAEPTPTVGGRLLAPGAGYQCDDALAARADVLSFTGEGIPLVHNGMEACNMKRLEFFEKDPIDWSQGEGCTYGALIKNEHDVQLLERLAFMHRRQTR